MAGLVPPWGGSDNSPTGKMRSETLGSIFSEEGAAGRAGRSAPKRVVSIRAAKEERVSA